MSDPDLFVISAPSGTGKTTLIRRLLQRVADLDFSVSFTTRSQRETEADGVDYHFVDEARFEDMLESGELLEWAVVHGKRYGTSARLVDESLAQGHDVLLDVDTQGAASVKQRRDEAVMVFIMPPDYGALKARLRSRGLQTEDDMARRLRNAKEEVERYVQYEYVVVNENLDEALTKVEGIVLCHRSRRRRMESDCRRIIESFRGD